MLVYPCSRHVSISRQYPCINISVLHNYQLCVCVQQRNKSSLSFFLPHTHTHAHTHTHTCTHTHAHTHMHTHTHTVISIVFSVCILLVLSLCLHHRCCHHRVSPSPPAHGGSFPVYSLATVDNARYSCDSQPTAEHSNEDRHFVTTGDTTVVFGVLDGHDGERGVVSVLNTMSAETYQGKDMASFLEHMIKNAESRFFGTLEDLIREKESLSKKIPPVSEFTPLLHTTPSTSLYPLMTPHPPYHCTL